MEHKVVGEESPACQEKGDAVDEGGKHRGKNLNLPVDNDFPVGDTRCGCVGARKLAQEEEGEEGRYDLNGEVGAGSRSADTIVSRNQISLWNVSVGCV